MVGKKNIQAIHASRCKTKAASTIQINQTNGIIPE
jgi:hypothetical protein